MSKWTKLKIIIGTIVSIFVILVIALLINISHFVNGKYEQPNMNNKQTVDNKLNIDDDIAEIVRQTAVKNNKWDDLPLSKKFKKKYNSKDGILVNDNYTKLSWSLSGTDIQQQIVTLIVFHNLKKEYYYIHYTLNESNELDDVEIVDKKLLYDENGNEVIYKKSMTEKNYLHNLKCVAYPSRLEYEIFEYINVTDNYLTKWKNGFVKGDYTFSIQAIEELCDYEKQIAYLKCEYPKRDENGDIADVFNPVDDELTLYYKVKFFTNKDLWLDDVEVEEVSKEEIDRLLSEKLGN